ncbi:phosphate acyltransferase [Actinocatenispora sera]|uniref:phosphate acyltransferase n=1 Tax=Actinocatenispora sera TaxID=390989 RepID=UPI0033EB957A
MTRSERRAARIAVDLLGGDDAPAVVVDGALLALNADPVLRLLPVGPRAVLDDLLARLPAAHSDRVEPVPVETDGTLPVHAAIRLVSADRADAVVSAGATGSAVRSAVAHCGRYPGLRRPALAVTVPAARGPLILLDVGAAPDPTAADLVRHAVLGAGYAMATLGVARPRVGLLSIGTEPGVGDELRRAADRLLAAGMLPPDTEYAGLVEGYDVPVGGVADVVVTDGFTGNVLLKGIEGALRLGSGPGELGVGGVPVADGVPRAAALLGVAAPVVVCHGAANGSDVASGIGFAARMATGHTIERVAQMDRVFRELTRAPGGVRGDEATTGPAEDDRRRQ